MERTPLESKGIIKGWGGGEKELAQYSTIGVSGGKPWEREKGSAEIEAKTEGEISWTWQCCGNPN